MSKYCSYCMAQLEELGEFCTVCGKRKAVTVPAHHLLPGTILNGKFYVGAALGEGGFGITYIGRDIKLDMKVAIKEFYPNGYVNRSNNISSQVNDSVTEGRRDFFEKGRERFLKEAQILAKFSGEPGVVDVRDFFEENNTAYIVMEFLDGTDLKTYLKKNGTLTPEHTVELLMPVMNSLKKVHEQGLIHRDISPDNIMIVGDKVKLLDFGAARNVSAAANKSLSVMLKPGYAPEEQYRSKGDQGPWTDIYALCATMYKCITGITPDDATQRVFSDEVKTPSALQIAIKPEIEKAIMVGMSVHQTDRYQSIGDLIKALHGYDIEIPVTDKTVAMGRSVTDDNIETVYAPNDAEQKTVMADSAMTPPQIKTQHTPVKENTVSQPHLTKSVQNAQSTKGEKKNGIIIVGAIIIAVLVAFVVFLILSQDEEKDSKEEKNHSSFRTKAPDDETSEPTSGSSSQTPENTTPTAAPTSTETPSTQTPTTQIQMSDNLFDFTFKLEGVVYQLPCKYETFTQNGWTISSSGYSSDTKISGNSYISFYMSKDGRKITVYSYNFSGNVKSLKECMIGGVECDEYNKADFVIAKGITVKSTVEEIKAAFGVPGYTSDGSGYVTLQYYAGDDTTYNSVRFWCDTTGEYSSISLKNFIQTKNDETTTNTQRPTYLAQYKKPTSIGKDFKTPIVKIEGDFYQLPAPVSSFVDNGWEIVQKSGDVVAGGTDYIRVEKNGKKIDLYIINYAEYQTIVENCAVYKVYISDYNNVDIQVGISSKTVSIGTAKSEVDAMVTDDFDYYESTSTCSYNYTEYKDREYDLNIRFNVETQKVSTITISCKTWKY